MVQKLASENVRLKRAYEPPSRADGKRVLVDRLWPRGVRKMDARIDEWLKDIAPSTALRKWFAHDPEHWAEFRRRYKEELKEHGHEIARLRDIAEKGRLTLVFAAHDEARRSKRYHSALETRPLRSMARNQSAVIGHPALRTCADRTAAYSYVSCGWLAIS